MILFILSFAVLGPVLGILFHEGGHWLVGRLLGIPILRVAIGDGPPLYRGQVGTTAIELGIGLGGEVVNSLLRPVSRLSLVLLGLGGVLGNVVLIVVIALLASGPSKALLDALGPGLLWAQVLMIVTSLIPSKGRFGSSDGYQILHALRYGSVPAATAAAAFYGQMLRPYQDAAAAAGAYSAASCRILHECRRLEAARERRDAASALLRELERGEARRDETLLILDALITRHLLHGDLGYGARLDELSSRAMALGADIPTLAGSRGGVLVELGRHEEAKRLLTPLAAGPPSYDSIVSQLLLARAEHGLGDATAAQNWLETARASLRTSPIALAEAYLARTEAAIGATTPRT